VIRVMTRLMDWLLGERTGVGMDCWHCRTELIWGGDDDLPDESEDFAFVTNLSCPKCGSLVEVYYPREGAYDKEE